MADLDELITGHVLSGLLVRDRVKMILEKLLMRQSARDEQRADNLAKIRERCDDAGARLSRLYASIEAGIIDPCEPTLKEWLAGVKAERDIARTALERAAAELSPAARITEEKIRRERNWDPTFSTPKSLNL